MPRQARVNIPGLLHHVMARVIERRAIFIKASDYEDFIERLEIGLSLVPGQVMGWALMPNHFHLLVRAGGKGISPLMQRVMTGYAVSFNKRYRRAGHLFQNRYKSIVCEEEPYLLELVRYIHLNPLRAKLVENLAALKTYPYCGHSALMGTQQRAWQETKEVLGRFSKKEATARRLVESVLKEVEGADNRLLDYQRRGVTIESLAEKIATEEGVPVKSLFERGRREAVSRAKALLIYLGVEHLGKASREMAKLTRMSDPGASKARARGAEIWETSRLKDSL